MSKQLDVSGTGRKSMYQLFKELTNIQDEKEFIKVLRENRVPEEEREYQGDDAE